jgi:hypothetical protein
MPNDGNNEQNWLDFNVFTILDVICCSYLAICTSRYNFCTHHATLATEEWSTVTCVAESNALEMREAKNSEF